MASAILTCEVEIILRSLVEDEELMNLLFSFLKPEHSRDTNLAVYFSRVVTCLMFHKVTPLVRYFQGHPEIFDGLVDLVGIAPIMEVLIQLIGADSKKNDFSPPAELVHLLEEIDLFEAILDKFSSSDSPIVQANATDILCATIDYAPSQIAAKIYSPSFVRRLFDHALNDSQPIKTVLIQSLAVFISLLDSERLASASNQLRMSNSSHRSLVTTSHETVECMLESLGNLLELLDIFPSGDSLPTTYGSLKPLLRRYRVKIVEFISVLLRIGSEVSEKKLLHLKAVKHVLDLFFEYPFNNVLHRHVVEIVVSCLDSKNSELTEHLFFECDILGRILEAEKQPTLSSDCTKPTVSTPGKSPPRKGNLGHLTQIANKIVELADKNSFIQTQLKENKEWSDWQNSVLFERNKLENVCLWECGHPRLSQSQALESDDEDQDRKNAVAELATELSCAFRYGIFSIDDIEEKLHLLYDGKEIENCLKFERRDSVTETLLMKGTTIMAVYCDTAQKWFLSGDTLSAVVNSDGSKSFMSNLKVAKASKRFVTMIAGDMAVSEVILLEIRTYLVRNQGKESYGDFSKIFQSTKDAIVQRLKSLIYWQLERIPNKDLTFGCVVLLDRKASNCLMLKVFQLQDKKSYVLTGSVQSRAIIGTQKVEDLFDKISDTDSLDVTREKILMAMEVAADENDRTGGMLTLFTGGKGSKWECIYAQDFKGPEQMKKALSCLKVEEESTDKTKVKIVEERRIFFKKLGPASVMSYTAPVRVDGMNIFVPPGGGFGMSGVVRAIEEGSYGSIAKYPKFRGCNFIVDIKQGVVRSKIKILLTEEFEVKVTTPIGIVSVRVNETTSVSNLREMVKKELYKNAKKLKNVLRLPLKLEPSRRKLKDDTIMFDIGVRACPDKENLLWDNNEEGGVLIDKVQERQKQYSFTIG